MPPATRWASTRAACQWQDGTNVAKWDNFNDPYSWGCFGALSASTFSIWTADTSGNFQQHFNIGDGVRIYARLPQQACVWVYEVKPDGSKGYIYQNSCNPAGTIYWSGTTASPRAGGITSSSGKAARAGSRLTPGHTQAEATPRCCDLASAFEN